MKTMKTMGLEDASVSILSEQQVAFHLFVPIQLQDHGYMAEPKIQRTSALAMIMDRILWKNNENCERIFKVFLS